MYHNAPVTSSDSGFDDIEGTDRGDSEGDFQLTVTMGNPSEWKREPVLFLPRQCDLAKYIFLTNALYAMPEMILLSCLIGKARGAHFSLTCDTSPSNMNNRVPGSDFTKNFPFLVLGLLKLAFGGFEAIAEAPATSLIASAPVIDVLAAALQCRQP